MRVRLVAAVATAVSTLLLLSACGNGKTEGHEDKDAKLAHALVGPIRPGTCSLDSNRKNDDPPEELPDTVSDKCTWQARGAYVGQSAHTFVTLHSTDETLQLRGFHTTNGSRLWQSNTVSIKRPDDEKKKYEKKGREDPRMLRSGKEVYAALFTTEVIPENAVDEERKSVIVRFVPVNKRGKLTFTTYKAPEGFEPLKVRHDAVTGTLPTGMPVLYNDESDEYLLVDPATADATPFTPSGELPDQAAGEWEIRGREKILTALADGSVLSMAKTARSKAGNGAVVIVRHANGSLRWMSSRVAPAGVNAGEAALSGIAGTASDRLILWWRAGSTADTRDTYGGRDEWEKRDLVVAAHDIRSGRAVFTHQRDFAGQTRTEAAAAVNVTGRYVTSGGVTFDLHKGAALSTAPRPLILTQVSSSGTAYGLGNDSREVAVDTGTGALLSDKEDGPEPIAASNTVLLFEKSADRKDYIIAFPFKD